jgi:hypothetical protein
MDGGCRSVLEEVRLCKYAQLHQFSLDDDFSPRHYTTYFFLAILPLFDKIRTYLDTETFMPDLKFKSSTQIRI